MCAPSCRDIFPRLLLSYECDTDNERNYFVVLQGHSPFFKLNLNKSMGISLFKSG